MKGFIKVFVVATLIGFLMAMFKESLGDQYSSNSDFDYQSPTQRCASNYSLSTFRFHCDSGDKDIPGEWYCDDIVDCADGSDESNDDCTRTVAPPSSTPTPFPPACPDDKFYCPTQHPIPNTQFFSCIYKEWVCDGGESDCSDNSDETDCFTCPLNQTRCRNYGSAYYCIPSGEYCSDPQYNNAAYRLEHGVTWSNRFGPGSPYFEC